MLVLKLIITTLGISIAEANFELEEKLKILSKDDFIDYFNTHNYSFTIANYGELESGFLLGVLPIVNALLLPIIGLLEILLEDLPGYFDAREKWAHCPTIADVYNQKQCGSCWAFGAASVASDRTCIHTGVNVRLSEKDFECVKKDVCHGGWPHQAFKFWKEQGLVTQDCKPYNIEELNQNKCVQKCVNGNPYEADKHYAEDVYQIKEDIHHIKAEIVTNGPVEAGIYVYEDFRSYKKGIYQYTYGKFIGMHSVRIIGFGFENGLDYWLVANTWGFDWGMKGLIKIRMKDPHVGIESQVCAGMPKK